MGLAHEVVVAMKAGNAAGAKDLWARGASVWGQAPNAVSAITCNPEDSLGYA